MKHAVKSNAREQQSHNGKKERQGSEQAFSHSVRLIDFHLCADTTHAEFRPRPRHFLAED
jgi:hypothetical protein